MKHALPPMVHNDTQILILGTMPGEKSIALQQYYANRGNHFWKILLAVLGEPFHTDYDVRMRLLAKHKIGLWNVLASCERKGSADYNIKNESPNDFKPLFEKYPRIMHIFFESKGAARHYAKHAIQRKGVTYETLPSVSGLNAGVSFSDKLKAWQRIAEVLHES
jgi:hypoxanthine-DNA glycosylase